MLLKKKIIRYSTQKISAEDIKSVSEALRSNFITEGPIISNFEKKLSLYTKARAATVVSSGSAALIMACDTLNLKNNFYLWKTSISFVASANCAFYFGAKVDFVDINEESFNIDVTKLKKKLK